MSTVIIPPYEPAQNLKKLRELIAEPLYPVHARAPAPIPVVVECVQAKILRLKIKNWRRTFPDMGPAWDLVEAALNDFDRASGAPQTS